MAGRVLTVQKKLPKNKKAHTMTKMIKVTCPSCKTPLSLPEQQLRDNDGRANCNHCGHSFRLIKKKKNENKPAAPRKNIFADVGTKDPIFPTDDFPTGEKFSSQPKKSQSKLNYREPKAESKNNTFADVEKKPLAFNMLDVDAVHSQIPQVSIKPAANSTTTTALTTGTPDQQNNITIHTDSLVFTLVGDNNNENNGVIDNNSNKPNAPIVVTSSNDLNWTIATIGLLIVLIVQLFYLVLMLQ